MKARQSKLWKYISRNHPNLAKKIIRASLNNEDISFELDGIKYRVTKIE